MGRDHFGEPARIPLADWSMTAAYRSVQQDICELFREAACTWFRDVVAENMSFDAPLPSAILRVGVSKPSAPIARLPTKMDLQILIDFIAVSFM